jgi:hypothetical protein
MRLLYAALAAVALSAGAQTDVDRARNIATCLEGRYPSLCKHGWLSPQEQQKAEAAERRENLKTCLTGRYPSLCKKGKLTLEEVKQVLRAEHEENLKTCLKGRYKALCKRNLLTETELAEVRKAEVAENLKTCLTGRYPALCDKSLLTSEQRGQTIEAERVAGAVRAKSPRGRSRISGNCEDGHWIESVSSDGSIIKLEDGSVWEVDAGDTVDSMLWLPVSDIVACSGKLINTDDNESVGATRIR